MHKTICEASVANCRLAAKASACLSPQGEFAQSLSE